MGTILLAWLLADFISGIAHWAQDRYLSEPSRFKSLNSIKEDNDLHHSQPTAMTRISMWKNMNTSAAIAWPIAVVLVVLKVPVVISLAVFLSAFANVIHRFAHAPRSKLPRVVKLLQATGLFISFSHHTKHHVNNFGLVNKEQADRCFCPMTNWLNPILDKIRFFKFLEWTIKLCKI